MDIFNKKILITGADGFIGSHLTEMLVKKGAKVKALAQYNPFNSWGWLEDINCLNDVEVISGDVRDPYYCKRITKNIDIVFHLAALIAIPYSYVAPHSYVETNINGTINICMSALENACSKVIHTSTSEVYGTAKYVPIDETHPLQPQSPYSASKISADAMAMSFYNAFDLPLVIARPFNTYGPRQSARAVIPTIITQILAKKEVISLGDLTPTRDLNYVEDTCQGFIALAESDKAIGETVNIGSNFEISMGDVVSLIKEIMKSNVSIISEKIRIRPKKSEVFRLWCDNSKIFNLTGFKPKYSIRDGLSLTIEWFSRPDILKKYKTDIYNV
ncbi:MAG: SDR family NAD(P)-dependent oxidoreductase [Desulfobacterales bacterium]|nr:SDR family NAD(P)-dependent oxidoreductase [Desulfobacterales bacterium]MBF0397360.1 SDR family NAD(P)-dependent oxidoreductase [Desulfobacterales bacterium]